jgi:RNA polymerase sigma-70 factor (ECF subfamily)
MGDAPNTRPSLLLRVRDPADGEAWNQFVELYGPLIYRFARKRHLQDADAADLTQTVLQAVAGAVRSLEYDPRRGLFRGWLFRVVRNQLSKFLGRLRRFPTGTGDEAGQRLLEDLPAREEDEAALWDREYERQLFLWAAERVRGCFTERSWQAFWRTAVEANDARETAAALGMSVGAVYTAKSRILDRVRKEIQQIHGDAEPGRRDQP